MEATVSAFDCDNDVRKRVCKACDRCRIKKSKCDGKKPCSRCKNDDTICVFGGRKKKTDRVHPKGYVEILERQQRQLVKGIRALYDRQLIGQRWQGPCPEHGYPSTHEILDFLGALDVEGSSDEDGEDFCSQFEDSTHRLRNSMADRMAPARPRPSQSPGPFQQCESLPSKRPDRYSRNAHRSGIMVNPEIPTQSPGSLTTSTTSPSTSMDSQHWSTSLWLEKGQILIADDLLECEQHTLESPMLDAFGDPFLAAPWDIEDDSRQVTV